MRVLKICGRVIDSKTQRGTKGLRVEAWDKDLLIDDLVGSAITGEDGTFRIQFDDSLPYFKELFFDRCSDLFFKVFRNQQLIKSTEDSVLWNQDREDIEVTIQVEEATGGSNMSEPLTSKQAPTRSLLQATYTPRKPRPGEPVAPRALEKGAFFARLAPSRDELDKLAARYRKEAKQPGTGNTTGQKAAQALGNLFDALSQTGKLDVLRSGKQLAGIEVDTLVRVAHDLIDLRHEALRNMLDAQTKILKEFARAGLSETGPETVRRVPAVSVKALMDWAVENNVERKRATKSLALAEKLSLNVQTLKPARFGIRAISQIERLRHRLNVFKENMSTEPIGYLHLERMSFTPAGIERGGLVYSVPLSPGEEVNIRHREWSHSSEEFERIVTDYLEEFSEEGVAEKSELSESVNSQTQHSTAFNTGVTASGSYGPVSITATVGYNASDSASQSEQLTRNQSTDITHKASSRAKKEHKISFRVASARETEDETVQRIKNPFPDQATRVDYYQLLRKWQVSLLRYGIRLTYDLVIPEPGAGLLSKIQEIQEIRRQLEMGFDAFFSLELTDIDRNNYQQLADQHGATNIERAPEEIHPISFSKTDEWPDEEVDRHRYLTLQIEVPTDYIVETATYDTRTDGQADLYFDPLTDVDHERNIVAWFGKSGQLPFDISSYRVKQYWLEIEGTARLSPDAYRTWQLKTLGTIRDAAQARYYELRQHLNQRLSRLQEELGSQDALTLRKKEREEVMKGVLEELGVPPEEQRENPGVIKFLHHAIEWENMLYFLYPYFWSDPQQGTQSEEEEQQYPYWEFKKYLDHPNPMHRTFLKAGAARVVLTIRPGFENAFMAFVNKIDFDELPPSPYIEIGQEFKNYAMTNYPGIPPANPVENDRPLLTPNQRTAWQDMERIITLLEDYRERPRQRQARQELRDISRMIMGYHHENGQYPADLDELESFIGEKIPRQDPWGNFYVYTCPGAQADYDLFSYGAEGEPGGEGARADITASTEIPPPAYPTTEEGLGALKTYFEHVEVVPTVDPWRNPYAYKCPGDHGQYDLICYGADGQTGGDGEDADITNWAEASLIGQWFEYTPTSALDIAFDETMPSK